MAIRPEKALRGKEASLTAEVKEKLCGSEAVLTPPQTSLCRLQTTTHVT
jgi:hypothetical protein